MRIFFIGYRNSNIQKNGSVKSTNLKYKNNVKNLFKKTTKLINERGISFAYVNFGNILELESKNPFSLINSIYSKEKEKCNIKKIYTNFNIYHFIVFFQIYTFICSFVLFCLYYN